MMKYIKKINPFQIVLTIIPILCAVVCCGLTSHCISDIYLPTSPWNDEVVYFKQVEGVLAYGIPQGYFGYNTSHAVTFTFASWNPLILAPWIVWGLLFGWDFLSPIICNIVIMSGAMFVFAKCIKCDLWKTLKISAVYILYIPLTRWTLSCCPETFFFAGILIFWGLIENCGKSWRLYKAIIAFAIVALLSVIRPYYLLLSIFLFLLVKEQIGRYRSVVLISIFSVLDIVAYSYIIHFFCAPYFAPISNGDFLNGFREGIANGIVDMVMFFISTMQQIVLWIKMGMFQGTVYLASFILMTVLLLRTIRFYFRKEKKQVLYYSGMLLCMLVLFLAFIYIYDVSAGSRHILPFLFIGIVMCVLETECYENVILLICTFILFSTNIKKLGYYYDVPYDFDNQRNEIENATAQLDDYIVINRNSRYDNTVVWVLEDTPWQYIYAFPRGCGINLCFTDYVISNKDCLDARYIYVGKENKIFMDQILDQDYIYQNDTIVIYDMKK